MTTVKDVKFGGFTTDVVIDDSVYAKIRFDAFDDFIFVVLNGYNLGDLHKDFELVLNDARNQFEEQKNE